MSRSNSHNNNSPSLLNACSSKCSECKTNSNIENNNENPDNERCTTKETKIPNGHVKHPHDDDTWGNMMMLGLSAADSLVNSLDPFAPLPKISVVPPSPDFAAVAAASNRKTALEWERVKNSKPITILDNDESPEDSPENEEHPYLKLTNGGMKR